MSVPRVEALRTSTLGYEIATPTELSGVRTIHNGLTILLPPRGHIQATTRPIPAFLKGKEFHQRPIQATTRPIPTFPKRKELHSTASNAAGRSSRHLGRAGEGPSGGMAGSVDGIIILPFFTTKSTKNIVLVSGFVIFFIILRPEREIRLRPVVISPGSGRSFIHTGAI